MSADNAADGLWYLMALVLVGSALLARRLPLSHTLKMAAIWLAIIGGAALLFRAFGGEFSAWQQARRGGTVSAGAGSAPGQRMVHIPMDEDGHYWLNAAVNGRQARFLIDSGASITALSERTANAAGVAIDTDSPPIGIETANGPAEARRATVSEIRIDGIIIRDLPVIISPGFGETNVIGMNILNKLRSWRVEKGAMILEAP